MFSMTEPLSIMPTVDFVENSEIAHVAVSTDRTSVSSCVHAFVSVLPRVCVTSPIQTYPPRANTLHASGATHTCILLT